MRAALKLSSTAFASARHQPRLLMHIRAPVQQAAAAGRGEASTAAPPSASPTLAPDGATGLLAPEGPHTSPPQFGGQVPGHRAYVWLSLMMLLWITVAPASWLAAVHPEMVQRIADELGPVPFPAPSDVMTKYIGNPAVVLTHQLPCAVWALLIPLQLTPSVRQSRPAAWHRAMGYATAASAVLLSTGVLLMLQRGMTGTTALYKVTALLVMTAWFLGTMGVAVGAARRRDFKAHRAWMARHAAAGVWVAVQRLIMMLLAAAPVVDWRAAPELEKLYVFDGASLVAWVLVVGACEWGLRREEEEQQQRGAAAVAKEQ